MKRNTTIDLLRIIAILFITTWHSFLFSSYGLRIDVRLQEMINENCFFTFGLCSVSNFLIIGVNLFFLISGYCRIKFSVRKIVLLMTETMAVYILFAILAIILGEIKFSIKWLADCIFCVRKYWYVNVYILLILFSPALNLLIDTWDFTKATVASLIFIFLSGVLYFVFPLPETGINSGYSIVSAGGLYFIGGVLKKHSKKIQEKSVVLCKWGGRMYSVALLILVVLILLSQFFAVAIFKNAKISWKLFSYNNILVMLFSICFFIAFLKIRIKENSIFEKAITLLYPSVFIIYVAQSCGFEFMKHFRSILIDYFANKFGLTFSTVFIIPNTVIVCSVLFIFYEIFNFLFKLLFSILDISFIKKTSGL